MSIGVFNEVIALKENKIVSLGEVGKKYVVTPDVDSMF